MNGHGLTVGSLFSGVGGMDIGFSQAGFAHAFFAEVDPYCRAVLAHRFPGVPIYDDVRAVRADGDEPGHVDVLAGGFPCQDLSVAGKRRGLAGERSGLFWEAMRIADALCPRAILLENVEGLYSSNGGRDFGVVLDALAERGYLVTWRTLDAQHFGVPQRRRRVFVCAVAGRDIGAERIGEIFALAESSSGDSPTCDPSWPLTSTGIGAGDSDGRGVVGALTGRSASRLDEQCVGGAARRVVGTLTASYEEQTGQDFGPSGAGLVTAADFPRERERERNGRGCGDEHDSARGRRLNGAGRPLDCRQRGIGVNPTNEDVAGTLPSNTQGGVRTTDIAGAYVVGVTSPNAATPDVAGTMTSRKGGARTTDLGPAFVYRKSARVNANPDSAETWVDDGLANTLNRFDVGDVRTTHAVVSIAENQRGELRETETAPAVTKGGGKPGEGYSAARIGATVRRLTPMECERLMGWPDEWTNVPWNGKDESPDTRRYQACGNGVVAPVAFWIAARLAEVLRDAE